MTMHKLLIVDDEHANLRLLERLFRQHYQCLTAGSGPEAMDLLVQHDVAVIITDQRMPEMTGIELLKRTAEMRPHMVRILLTGYTDMDALVDAVNCGLVNTYVKKPWENQELKQIVSNAVVDYGNNKRHHTLSLAIDRLSTQIREMRTHFIKAMSEMVRANNEATFERSFRLSHYCELVGQFMGLDPDALENLSAAALLHYCGNAVGSSNNEDTRITLEQSESSARILRIVPELRDVAEILRFYHENFDGTGQPKGAQRDQLPLGSRILRVVEAYDLLINAKESSKRVDHSGALARLRQGEDKEFDGRVLHALEQISGDLLPDPLDLGEESDIVRVTSSQPGDNFLALG